MLAVRRVLRMSARVRCLGSAHTVEAAAVRQATGVPVPGEQGRAVTAANRAAARDATRQGAAAPARHLTLVSA